MFKTRLISSIALVLIMVAAIFAGTKIFSVLFTVISLIGMMEIYRIYNIHKSILAYISYGAVVAYNLLCYWGNDNMLLMVIVIYVIAIMGVYVCCFPKYDANQCMTVVFGMLYVGVLMSYMSRIRCMNNGLILIWLVFICSWINDTCAYCVGVLIGKHKMTPKLSPKKSIEGAVGGIAGAAAIAAVYGFVFQNWMTSISNPPVVFAIACGAGAFISIFGDLCASAIKRNNNIKDYGTLIPGHGGIMDRFDSVIITAPIVYYVLYFFVVR